MLRISVMGFFGERRQCACGVWYVAIREPYLCALCASTLEREQLLGEPLKDLSLNDRRFLKSLRINADE